MQSQVYGETWLGRSASPQADAYCSKSAERLGYVLQVYGETWLQKIYKLQATPGEY
jgi:hypothetical protein